MTLAFHIISFSLKIIITFFSLYGLSCSGQQGIVDSYRFLDSANVYIDIDSKQTWKFLDSIPKPIHEHIKGRVAEYYAVKALVHDEYNQYSKFYQSNILALKYGIKEKNYCVAGQASLDLYTDKYLIAEDTTNTKYLDQARTYLEKCETYKYAVLQIEEMQSYYKSLDGKFEKSNAILFDKLDYYKSIKNEEGYYYMFANYLLATNYIQLNKLKTAHKYFNELKNLKNNSAILPYNHKSFLGSVNLFFAEVHFEKARMDSTFYYLQKASKHSKYMAGDALKDYYKLFANAHKKTGNTKVSEMYVDSLVRFQDELYFNNIEASFDINNDLLEAESALNDKKKEKATVQKVVFCLLGIVAMVSLLYLFFYRKHKTKLKTVESKTENLSYLKSNNKQLAIKVHGLELYIKNLKKEVKDIATVKCLEHQKSRIKELYTNLHINSSTIMDKGESHLELINDLNIDFFKKIEQLYPQLSKSEIIICYYILVGFTNKEISVFLNTSVRSVESKRYRISKKIDFDKSEITLLEHLQLTFSDTLHNTTLLK